MDKARIKEFVKERDTAIMEFDLKKFKRFIKKWHHSKIIPSDEVLKVTILGQLENRKDCRGKRNKNNNG